MGLVVIIKIVITKVIWQRLLVTKTVAKKVSFYQF